MNNYAKNKIIFNKIISDKYIIKKDLYEKDILYIETNNKKIKCKYIMFLIEKKISTEKNDKSNKSNKSNKITKSIIMWSDSNPYIDKYTQELSKIIRDNVLNNPNILNQNNQIILKNDLDNLIKILIKNQFNFTDNSNNNIYCQWIITNVNNNFMEYYMITEIIYL
jgi:hypothetical protein